MGSGTVKPPPMPAAPPAAPDLTDDAVMQARRAQMRLLMAKRGLSSTFVTTPQPGVPAGAGDLLGGSLGSR